MPGVRSSKKAKAVAEEEQEMVPDVVGPQSTRSTDGSAKKSKKKAKASRDHEDEVEEHTPNGISGRKRLNGALSDAESENEEPAGDDIRSKTKKKRKRSKKSAEGAESQVVEQNAASVAPPAKKKREKKGGAAESDEKLEAKRKGASEGAGREVKVHVSRFIEYQPQSITAMAYDPRGRRLAVARGNGDIQLWSAVAPRWHPIATLAGSTHRKIRALAWAPPPADDDDDDDDDDSEEEEAPAGPGKKRRGSTKKKQESGAEGAGEMRLLSGSLDGTITEWSLSSLAPVSVTDSHGGSVWSMAVSGGGELLAVGCHDGGVRLFDLSQWELTFKKGLPPHPGQTLCVAWASNDRVLVSGDSFGQVRVWGVTASPPSCSTVSVMAPSAHHAARDRSAALVWAVAVMPDLTVFAADSKGRTHAIDGRMGMVLKSFVAHHGADALSVVSDGYEVFSGGVDGRVVHYRRVRAGGGDGGGSSGGYEWVIAGAQRYHTHDVLCLCLAGTFSAPRNEHRLSGRDHAAADPSNRREAKAPALDAKRAMRSVVSGGLDTQLCVYTYGRGGRKGPAPQAITQAIRLPPWPHLPCVGSSGLAGEEVRMVTWQSSSLDLWRWRVAEGGDGAAGTAVAVGGSGGGGARGGSGQGAEPRYAVRVNTQAEENIVCAVVSPDGEWVAVAHATRLSVYRLREDAEGAIDVDRCELPPAVEAVGANALAFLCDSRRLAVAAQGGAVMVVELGSFEVQASYTPSDLAEGRDRGARPAINRLAVSQDGQWLAACDTEGQVLLLSPEATRTHTALPALPARVTALRFAPSEALSQQVLVIVTADNRVYLFDAEQSRLSSFPPPDATTHAYAPLLSYAHHCQGICFNPSAPGSLLLWGHSFLCSLDLNPSSAPAARSAAAPHEHRRKRWSGTADVTEGEAGFKMIHKYSPMLAVDFIAGDHLLLVERPWLQVLSQIGGTMYRKRFGK